MTRKLVPLACVAALAGLSACKESAGPADHNNPLLRYVPTDAVFVLANLEPVPSAITDAQLERSQPMMEQWQQGIDELQDRLANLDAEEDATAGLADLILALADELDGKLNREGIESLGFALESASAIYSYDLLPVMRLEVSDPEKIRAMIARIETRVGTAMPEQRLNDQSSYWMLDEPTTGVRFYLALLDDHLAAGLAPAELSDHYLPHFLGETLPAESMDTSGTLQALNAAKGFTPYVSGYLQLEQLAEMLLTGDSASVQWLSATGGMDRSAISTDCLSEVRQIMAMMPRMVLGNTALEKDRVDMRYQLELEPSLAEQLQALTADVPPASDAPERMVSLSLNVELGRLIDFVRSSANQMMAEPFRCAPLEPINEQMRELAVAVNQPLPPFLGNFKGLRAELATIDPAQLDPGALAGLLSLEMKNPQMMMGMASMFVPGMDQMPLEPGADPAPLPEELFAAIGGGLEVYAVMAQEAIGLSFGAGEQAALSDFMALKSDDSGTLFSIDYDMATLLELQQDTFGSVMAEVGDPELNARLDAMNAANAAMMGRIRMAIGFDSDGINMDVDQRFP